MAARTARSKRNRLASRRRLNVARPTEGRALLPTMPQQTAAPLVRLLVQTVDRDQLNVSK
jgi:hypothetical protein